MSIYEKLKRRYWKKQEYQFGSPIVSLYAYNNLLVVATKLDLFITQDGVNYERVEVGNQRQDTQVPQ